MPSARAQMKRPVNSAPQSCLQTSPTLGDKPPQEGRTVKSHRGSEDSTTLWTSTSLSREGIFAQLLIMLRNIPNKDGQPPSSKLSASLSGGSIVCFDSGWPKLFGDFGASRFDPRRKAVMEAARRTVYGANMLPQTTDFGVTPDEARALHRKQHESDSKMLRFHVIAGKAEYIIDFFQPRGIRSKGKNATVFYPQGSPTVASAQSQAAAEDAAIQEEDGNL
ncbi:hypothetical protein FOVG_02025 [Fusarium oxysporum f. sp. pisi HDV247]|uniref:Uncharacterized protein n=1 Tax=Fusarium oxysporum f. sp. pisi HDV247 TaxID=1080344 RepID=W9QHN5_FUSOX|nr:hypothetical protein FOVG_02025 [Fusarium oxysporum f. sp. pisi HDV247]